MVAHVEYGVVFLPKRATRKSELRLQDDLLVGVTFRVTKWLISTAFFDQFRTQIIRLLAQDILLARSRQIVRLERCETVDMCVMKRSRDA